MGLFGAIDKVLGTDFSGNKARGYIDKATGQANAANQAAMQIIQQYGDKAMNIYKDYMQKGLNESEAAQEAAIDTLKQYGGEAGKLYEDRIREGLGRSDALYEAAATALQGGMGGARETMETWGQKALDARAPYDEQVRSLLDTIPSLKAAMGLPSDTTYDVQASPMYQWQKQQMDEALTAQMNAMGQSGSPASAYIRSKNLGQLGASETQRQLSDLMNTANMGLSYGQNLGQLEAGLGLNLANLDVNQAQALASLLSQQGSGALNAFTNMGSGLADITQNTGAGIANTLNQQAMNRSNIYNAAGANLGQTTLGIGGNLAQGQIGMGQNLLNAGLSKATMPNPMNQLINTGLSLYGMGAFTPRTTAPAASSGGSVGGFSFNNTPRMYGLNF